MTDTRSLRRPASEPAFASFLTVASAFVTGLACGELLVTAAYGVRPEAWLAPWWLAAGMIVFALVGIVRTAGFWWRLALLLFACSQLVAVAEAAALSRAHPYIRLGLMTAMALAAVAAGWRSARRWARVVACVALVAGVPARYWVVRHTLGLGIGMRGARASDFCECLTLDGALKGLQGIGAENWTDIGRATLERERPTLPVGPCEEPEEPESVGLDAAMDRLARCCDVCDLCGGAVVHPRPEDAALLVVDVYVCPQSQAFLLLALDSLKNAVAAPEPLVRSGFDEDDQFAEGESWTRDGVMYMMHSSGVEIDGGWLGHFQVGRCALSEVTDTWSIGDWTVNVLQSCDEDHPSDELWFTYATRCALEDVQCHQEEMDALWPRLSALADDRKAASIFITPEDCLGGSTMFPLERSEDGTWKGTLWSPTAK